MIHQHSYLLEGVEVHLFIDIANLIDVTYMAGFFELLVGAGDVALAGNKELTGNYISIICPTVQNDLSKVGPITYRRVASSLIPSTTSPSRKPAGLFNKP